MKPNQIIGTVVSKVNKENCNTTRNQEQGTLLQTTTKLHSDSLKDENL